MTRVLVLGKNGQIASEIRRRAADSPDYRFLSRDEIASSTIAGCIESLRPEFVVNCAAYTAVDKAEQDSAEAFRLNRDFVREVAIATAKVDSHFIHFSTDYVFDGESRRPYVETDDAKPLGVYGQSKFEGEREVFAHANRATILRTAWVYSQFGQNFVKTIVRLANDEKPLRVVDDQFGTPTAAGDLADFIMDCVIPREKLAGVELFHFTGEGETTWNGFAREIASLWKTRQRDIIRIPTSEFPTPAARPRYSVLSKEKLKSGFDVQLLDWREALRKRCWAQA